MFLKKTLLATALCVGIMPSLVKARRPDIREIICVTLGSNAVLGYTINLCSPNTTKGKIIANGLGGSLAFLVNYLGAQIMPENQALDCFGQNRYNYNPKTHAALAATGYLIGGMAGYGTRAILAWIHSCLFNSEKMITKSINSK